uniref:SRCR domain-containing protein n=1 Tax=Astyanax mexicanus TaxID=7994 RepID=A0A3B1J8E2_ASTMX
NTFCLSDSVRLVGGVGSCSGRLEVETRYSWTTVCETDFDWRGAVVLCGELNCGTPVTLQGALFGKGKRPFGLREFQCEGTEKSILTCNTLAREENTCIHGKAVGLICSGVLVKPSISFSSPKTISTYFPKQHVIQSDSDFTITCSTQPQFQGGSFKLKVPWNNEPYTQHADNHLASYLCPEAEKMYHDGNYSCVYENHVNVGRNVLLTSESETHTVFIQGKVQLLQRNLNHSTVALAVFLGSLSCWKVNLLPNLRVFYSIQHFFFQKCPVIFPHPSSHQL